MKLLLEARDRLTKIEDAVYRSCVAWIRKHGGGYVINLREGFMYKDDKSVSIADVLRPHYGDRVKILYGEHTGQEGVVSCGYVVTSKGSVPVNQCVLEIL